MNTLACFVVLLGVVYASPKCTKDAHGVYRFNGKPCASTTRYDDGHRGACGCGPANSDTPFAWNLADFVTAPNQKFFDDGGDSQWCGRNCGHCVKLTPTGGFVNGEGAAPHSLTPHIFMVTNDCPIQGNEEWCGQTGKPGTNHVNTKGYEVHFDLQNNKGQVSNQLGWNNPEVTWESVACPGDLVSKWHQCECFSHAGK
ncbi:endoglucanase-like [Biomphalaria glabrata]|uniref:Endoglucanase-like n=2 Tax=Biomphalaria TaxID=6525 RepID=A0A9W3BM43_BIOGL|nr:endoglucanase-like [Biomphalaria glabrata]KAI8760571.1 endoglucanase [Biomphalaria glabrata]KAK0068452.1 endoglucanase [Biomphalaria pfeifferi]